MALLVSAYIPDKRSMPQTIPIMVIMAKNFAPLQIHFFKTIYCRLSCEPRRIGPKHSLVPKQKKGTQEMNTHNSPIPTCPFQCLNQRRIVNTSSAYGVSLYRKYPWAPLKEEMPYFFRTFHFAIFA